MATVRGLHQSLVCGPLLLVDSIKLGQLSQAWSTTEPDTQVCHASSEDCDANSRMGVWRTTHAVELAGPVGVAGFITPC